ncbi:hypothetical protein B7993_08905 [Fibrobacter sp. UWH3]|nr:hypothetical protein B7993_08905 [Fibrobacter sp. UWH3]
MMNIVLYQKDSNIYDTKLAYFFRITRTNLRFSYISSIFMIQMLQKYVIHNTMLKLQNQLGKIAIEKPMIQKRRYNANGTMLTVQCKQYNANNTMQTIQR